MANASKDPYWQAIVSSEVIHHPQLEDVVSIIFDDGFLNPTNYLNEAALDGVSSSLCHQIQASNLGDVLLNE